jgi:molybdate transport system substrate-binding protein
MKRALLSLTFALNFLVFTGQARADEIRVAVASNFADPIKEIAGRFEAETGHRVVLAFGSTGRLYAQIKNGAPFEAFFAADVEHPERLEVEGIARPGSRFTYAVGRVVLWSPRPDMVDAEGGVLNTGAFRHIAIANPRLAPYGHAAEQVLRARGVWDGLQGRIVRGENIGQTFQFVKSGNAELGFVAYAQVRRPNGAIEGSIWEPPQSLYRPIEQQAVLIKEEAPARAFMSFVKRDEARVIIHRYGYGTP